MLAFLLRMLPITLALTLTNPTAAPAVAQLFAPVGGIGGSGMGALGASAVATPGGRWGCFGADPTRLFVVRGTAQQLVALDAATGAVLATLPCGFVPVNVTYDAGTDMVEAHAATVGGATMRINATTLAVDSFTPDQSVGFPVQPTVVSAAGSIFNLDTYAGILNITGALTATLVLPYSEVYASVYAYASYVLVFDNLGPVQVIDAATGLRVSSFVPDGTAPVRLLVGPGGAPTRLVTQGGVYAVVAGSPIVVTDSSAPLGVSAAQWASWVRNQPVPLVLGPGRLVSTTRDQFQYPITVRLADPISGIATSWVQYAPHNLYLPQPIVAFDLGGVPLAALTEIQLTVPPGAITSVEFTLPNPAGGGARRRAFPMANAFTY